MTNSYLFNYWTCKIAENPAKAEEFRVTKLSAIAGFYCIWKKPEKIELRHFISEFSPINLDWKKGSNWIWNYNNELLFGLFDREAWEQLICCCCCSWSCSWTFSALLAKQRVHKICGIRILSTKLVESKACLRTCHCSVCTKLVEFTMCLQNGYNIHRKVILYALIWYLKSDCANSFK